MHRVSKFWSRLLWAIVFLYFLAMLVIWLIPEKVDPDAAQPDEINAVQEKVLSAQADLPQVRIDKAVAKPNRVVAVFVTWADKQQPFSFKERTLWNEEARKVARVIGARYLPEDWFVNVAVYFKRLPRGLAGMSASTARQEAEAPPAGAGSS